MNATMWPVFTVRHVLLKDFVQFWEQTYSGYDEEFYRKNIGMPLTDNRIARWFEWKNGPRLSAAKKQTIRRYRSPEERINHNADAESLTGGLANQQLIQREGSHKTQSN